MMLLVLFLILFISCTWGKLIGAAVIPHGDFAYDPSLVDYKNGSVEIHQACLDVAKLISSWDPDVVLLSTPHGIALKESFAIYQNSNASGFALIGEDLHNSSFPSYKVPLNFRMNRSISENLTSFLTKMAQKVEGILSFADSEAIAVRWGEVIPMSFLNNLLTKPTLILSHPTRRYTETKEMVPELLTLGQSLFEFLDPLPERVVIIISSDLAHTHLESGPYGYSKWAEPFDEACGTWATSLHPDPLLQDAKKIVDSALSCGYTGLVMLHGALTAGHINRAMNNAKINGTVNNINNISSKNNFTQNNIDSNVGNNTSINWHPILYANFHPTYYGMMVASFERLN